jgi:hypothetical protein
MRHALLEAEYGIKGGVKDTDFVLLLVAHSSQFTKRRRQSL